MKVKVGIIGTGNIGTDLLYKINKSDLLECTIFSGRSGDSKGISIAKNMGIITSTESINYFVKNPECADIVFDATSASAHMINFPILRDLRKFVVNITPARIGDFCIPVLNKNIAINTSCLNMVTCGGQASIPIACAIKSVCNDVKYFEIVASISSFSAGIGTRNNIDEFTETTSSALKYFTSVESSKAIIILNPAEPPVEMRNTVYALIDNPDMGKIKIKVKEMEEKIKKYVPGYSIITEPVFENGRVTTIVQVVGSGDYLPSYAGNLDIITCAAVDAVEYYVKRKNLNV